MALVRIALEDGGLVAALDTTRIAIPAEPNTGEAANVKIWSSSVKGEFYGDEINEWFSEELRTKCRLVLMPAREAARLANW